MAQRGSNHHNLVILSEALPVADLANRIAECNRRGHGNHHGRERRGPSTLISTHTPPTTWGLSSVWLRGA
jgi:hypothetical protein